jgi:UDP-N-acetylglucosamine acyltransferase
LSLIHPTSVIDPKAELASDVRIGPFCVVEGDVQIGKGTVLESHVSIKSNTRIGEHNYIAQGAVLGGDPQDRRYQGEPTYLIIGNGNNIREYVTIHRATGEDMATTIGDENFIMAYCHVGHNCELHDRITMANNVGISGYVTIESMVTIGGMTGIHQFVRVGKLAMVAGISRIVQDVPPFMISGGYDQQIRDINAIGLRRLGINQQARMSLHKACKLLFKSQLGLRHAMDIVRREVPQTEEVEYLLDFLERLFRGKSGRGDQP